MKKFIPKKNQADYILIVTVAILIVIGLVMLSSASSVLGYEKFKDSFWYIKHQLLYGFLPGLLALILLSRIDYLKWKKFALPALFISLGLLLAVFVPGIGVSYGRAKSWINVASFSLQPAEIVKLTFLLYLASWLERRGERIKGFFYGFLPFVFLLGIVMVLIALQPDIGTMAIIVLMSLVVYFIAGAPFVYLFGFGLAGSGLLYFLIKIVPYRALRLAVFLNPELDPQGVGYHINQALLAIGSGGLWGLGLGHSRQKFAYLPEPASDSIFAIIAEEVGFAFILILITLFLIFMWRGFKIARWAPDKFGKFLAGGITSWIIIQFFINLGSMIGLLPLTGLPLPFISYGGTALFIEMAAIGILINISKRAKI